MGISGDSPFKIFIYERSPILNGGSFVNKERRKQDLRRFFPGDPPVPQNEKVLTRFSQVGAPLAVSAFPFINRPRLST